jgi:hypothetical protein
MHRPDPRKLDPLDVVRGVPVVAQQLRQPRARQEAAQPGPRARRGVRGGHEEADVGLAGFVAAAREHDVAEAGGLRGAEGGERRGGGGVVVFARGQRRSAVGVLCGLWRGRRRGRGCGWRCGGTIAGTGLGSRRGRGGGARGIGPWNCGSLGRVSWSEEQREGEGEGYRRSAA